MVLLLGIVGGGALVFAFDDDVVWFEVVVDCECCDIVEMEEMEESSCRV